jgi:hypothetical protein
VCRLIEKMSRSTRADFVFIDLGPSTGALNELFVMSSDYILPPCSPDQHSFHSTRRLIDTVLCNWFSDSRKARFTEQDDHNVGDQHFPRHDPYILPLFVSKYWVIKKHVDKRCASFLCGYSHFMENAVQIMSRKVAAHQPHDTAERKLATEISVAAERAVAAALLPLGGRYVLPVMRNLNSLEKAASQHQRAFHELEPADYKGLDGAARVNEDMRMMSRIAHALCQLPRRVVEP